MGWANCGEHDGRPIGYAVEATCDQPDCEAEIDRGLSYVCGRMHGGDNGCGGYFCSAHLVFGAGENQMCEACADEWDRQQAASE